MADIKLQLLKFGISKKVCVSDKCLHTILQIINFSTCDKTTINQILNFLAGGFLCAIQANT